MATAFSKRYLRDRCRAGKAQGGVATGDQFSLPLMSRSDCRVTSPSRESVWLKNEDAAWDQASKDEEGWAQIDGRAGTQDSQCLIVRGLSLGLTCEPIGQDTSVRLSTHAFDGGGAADSMKDSGDVSGCETYRSRRHGQ